MSVSIAVIGGGAAGLFFACHAIDAGADVTIFERNEKCGRKLGITGKGRCNLTNSCSVSEFIESVVTNPKFMYTAINVCPPNKVMAYFEDQLGVPLKTERGNRVFPQSDRAGDVVYSLVNYCGKKGCKIINALIDDIVVEDSKACGVVYGGMTKYFDKIVMATGGVSYISTGSDGTGHKIAQRLGLSVTPLKPSLIPLTCSDKYPSMMQGLSLKNISITVVNCQNKKEVYHDFGELLFTHFGLSGPVILSASSHIKDITPGKYQISIDLKPALDSAALDRRLLSDFEKYKNKDFSNALSDLLPSKMIPVFIERSGISPSKKVNSITREEREKLISLFKSFTLAVNGTRPINEAIITCGGVSIKEINPKTMECKKIKNLYFAGEIIDVDAYTGGFNLQIAFSTAYLAALSATTE